MEKTGVRERGRIVQDDMIGEGTITVREQEITEYIKRRTDLALRRLIMSFSVFRRSYWPQRQLWLF